MTEKLTDGTKVDVPARVDVLWVDSRTNAEWQHAMKQTDLLCLSAGFLVWEDAEGITVASSWDRAGFWGGQVRIPKCSIVDIKRYPECKWGKVVRRAK